MIQVVAAIYPFQVRKQAKFKQIEYAIALSGLHKLVKKLVGEAEAHAEVEKKSRILILEEDLVATDLVDSSVEREGSHITHTCLSKR